jgi:adenylate cyclase
LGRTAEAKNAAEVLLSNYPSLTVERMIRHLHWKTPGDVTHYREGLLKAGIPFGKVTLIESSPRLAADS